MRFSLSEDVFEELSLLLLSLILPYERDLRYYNCMMALYSSDSGLIRSFDLRVKVDFRSLALSSSFWKTRREKIPMRMERASDH